MNPRTVSELHVGRSAASLATVLRRPRRNLVSSIMLSISFQENHSFADKILKTKLQMNWNTAFIIILPSRFLFLLPFFLPLFCPLQNSLLVLRLPASFFLLRLWREYSGMCQVGNRPENSALLPHCRRDARLRRTLVCLCLCCMCVRESEIWRREQVVAENQLHTACRRLGVGEANRICETVLLRFWFLFPFFADTMLPSPSFSFSSLLLLLPFLLPSCLAQDQVIFPAIKEEQEPGQVVGNIMKAADLASNYNPQELQQLRFEFVKNDGIAQYFHLIENSGELRTRLRIDRDTLCKSDGLCCPSFYRTSGGASDSLVSSSGGGGLARGPLCTINFAVRVSPAKFFRLIRVSVSLEDINDNAPTFDTAKRSFQVSETSPPNTEISLPMARDPDAGDNGITDYKLSGGGGVFQLRKRGNAREGFTKLSLVTKKPLDREKKAWYAVNITVMDSGRPTRKTGLLQVRFADTASFLREFSFERQPRSSCLEI